MAILSDDLDFVEAHLSDYGLDRVTGQVRFIRGNNHYKSIFDSYLMSLCPIIVGSVGAFAATTSLIADPPCIFIRARPDARTRPVATLGPTGRRRPLLSARTQPKAAALDPEHRLE